MELLLVFIELLFVNIVQFKINWLLQSHYMLWCFSECSSSSEGFRTDRLTRKTELQNCPFWTKAEQLCAFLEIQFEIQKFTVCKEK